VHRALVGDLEERRALRRVEIGVSSAIIRAVRISVDVTLNQAPLGANKYS
jgi:hypothetical protein